MNIYAFSLRRIRHHAALIELSDGLAEPEGTTANALAIAHKTIVNLYKAFGCDYRDANTGNLRDVEFDIGRLAVQHQHEWKNWHGQEDLLAFELYEAELLAISMYKDMISDA